MLLALQRLMAFLGARGDHRPPDDDRDPLAWRPAPRQPQPKPQSGAVAVAEPDE